MKTIRCRAWGAPDTLQLDVSPFECQRSIPEELLTVLEGDFAVLDAALSVR